MLSVRLPSFIHIYPIICLASAAAIYLWPLLSQLTSAIPGTDTDLDVASYVWNVWWAKQALETSASIFRSDEVIIPFGVDLRVHTYGPLLPLLAYPFTFFLGIVGAYNLVLVVMFFLNGLAARGGST